MNAGDELLLRPDVELVPVDELPANMRERLTGGDGFVVIRRHSRIPSSVISRDAAQLLEQFREPRSIAEAVVRYSIPRKLELQHTMREALPLVTRLIATRDLVTTDSDLAIPVSPTLAAGDGLAGFIVVSRVRLLDDAEIYKVERDGKPALLKIANCDSGTRADHELENELRILRHLGGAIGPAVLAHGRHNGRRYLVLDWFQGLDAEHAALALRNAKGGIDRQGMLDLCRNIVDAYAELHGRGVCHGDIHPGNLIVDAQSVRLIDFGLARRIGDPDQGPIVRAGVGPFLEPEYAVAALVGDPLPVSTPEGEQYSVAALLHLLVTGAHYRDFGLERPEMFAAIANDPPLSFRDCGGESWPELEGALSTALEKDPAKRFASMAEFARAIRVSPRPGNGQREGRGTREAERREFINSLEAEIGFGSDALVSGLPRGPRASLSYGSAGIAFALYRIALAEKKPATLALADAWALRACEDIDRDDAFRNADFDIGPETVGKVSPYHTASGVFAVRALIETARGDTVARTRSLQEFERHASAVIDNVDLTLGRSGVLLAAALLYESSRGSEIETFGAGLATDLLRRIRLMPRIGAPCGELGYLGIAHGWAGVLYAQLRWCQATDTAPSAEIAARLDELAALTVSHGDFHVWPLKPGPADSANRNFMPGWCHGSAGYVFLWLLAGNLLDRPSYIDLAVGAARYALAAPGGIDQLCCGLAGRAYSLFALFRETGDESWLDGAWALAGRAVETMPTGQPTPLSLFKGRLGIAVLLADLAVPESAAMPFFEAEGWPR